MAFSFSKFAGRFFQLSTLRGLVILASSYGLQIPAVVSDSLLAAVSGIALGGVAIYEIVRDERAKR